MQRIRMSLPYYKQFGYEAKAVADGTVTKAGQCVLDSADEQAIRFARDVAPICGIGYSPYRSKWRLGRGTEPTEL